MPEIVRQNIVIPLGGLTQDKETDGSKLGEDTVNFYPDGEGYLVNYPGRTEYFKRGNIAGVEALTFPATQPGKSVSSPPVGEFSRIFFYRDTSGQQHIVFVKNRQLCVVEGNGYRVLYEFKGQGRSQVTVEDLEGKTEEEIRIIKETFSETRKEVCYPHLFMHKNFLVIANLGDPMLTWDGFRDVAPLGVTEAPNAPSVSVSHVPWYPMFMADDPRNVTDFGETPWTMASVHSYHGHLAGGHFGKYGYYGNQGIWPSGPIPYEPGGHYHGLQSDHPHMSVNWNDTKWSWKVRYFDRYGNLGPASAASPVVAIPKNSAVLSHGHCVGGSIDTKNSLANWDGKSFATVYWNPPKHDWHIAGSILYKTLDLHEDKANSSSTYYVEKTFHNATICRHTSVAGDSALSDNSKYDRSVSGPPSTDLAASWGSRIVARDPEFKEKLLYSDGSRFGEFRSSNVYNAKDFIEAILPMGDRLLIVTRSTSEILYYNREGSIQHLETYEDKGSSYGPSFSVFGDQVFGLFNDGFFLFDGQRFIETNTPYYLEKDYIDKWQKIQKSVVQGEWYFLSVRKEVEGEENNHILMCHLPTSRWFQVTEDVRDLAVIGDYILGVKDSIYFLYRGNTYPDSEIHIKGLLSDQGVLREKTLSSASLLIEPSSFNEISLEVSGSDSTAKKTGSAVSYPSKSSVTKDVNYYPYYDDGKTRWHVDATSTNKYDWVSPNDFHIRMDIDNNVTDFKHDVNIKFKGSQRIKAVGFEYSVGAEIADKK